MTYAKIGGIVALALALFGSGWYLSSLKGLAQIAALRASAAENERAASDTALKKDADYDKRLAKANEDHAALLRALADRLPNTDPIIVRRTTAPLCPSPLPDHAAARGSAPGPRAVESGAGERDIRPAIEAFKARIEAVVSDCILLRDAYPDAAQSIKP